MKKYGTKHNINIRKQEPNKKKLKQIKRSNKYKKNFHQQTHQSFDCLLLVTKPNNISKQAIKLSVQKLHKNKKKCINRNNQK